MVVVLEAMVSLVLLAVVVDITTTLVVLAHLGKVLLAVMVRILPPLMAVAVAVVQVGLAQTALVQRAVMVVLL